MARKQSFSIGAFAGGLVIGLIVGGLAGALAPVFATRAPEVGAGGVAAGDRHAGEGTHAEPMPVEIAEPETGVETAAGEEQPSASETELAPDAAAGE